MDAHVFGAFLRECRTAKDLTQQQLAEQLHVTAKAVSRWERGVGFPDIQTLEPLAAALDVSLPELMLSRRIQTVSSQDASAAVADALELAGNRKGAWRSPWWWVFNLFLFGVLSFLLYLMYFRTEGLWLRVGGIGSVLVLGLVCSDAVHALVLRHLNPGMEPARFGWRKALGLLRDITCMLLLLISLFAEDALAVDILRAAAWTLLIFRDGRRWIKAVLED